MDIDPRYFRLRRSVLPQWIDEYGHLNMAYYVLICDHATAAFWDAMNAPKTQEARGGAEYAVVETHVNYLDELRRGAAVLVATQLLAADSKRFRIFHRLHEAETGTLAATNEVMALGFDLTTRGAMPFVPPVREALAAALERQAGLERHANAGRAIGQAPKRP